MVVELLWVKGELKPADMPLRWTKYTSPDDMVYAVLQTKLKLDIETIHTPLAVRTMCSWGYRGGVLHSVITGGSMEPEPRQKIE